MNSFTATFQEGKISRLGGSPSSRSKLAFCLLTFHKNVEFVKFLNIYEPSLVKLLRLALMQTFSYFLDHPLELGLILPRANFGE